MQPEFIVYALDDDPLILEVLRETLAGQCLVECFTTAEACLNRVREQVPNLFLIDVQMPDMDGFSFCRHVRDDWETSGVPVIFISASDDIETRLQCYEAGGDDFVIKPVMPAELLLKIGVARRIFSDKSALQEQAGYATRTAMSAMTSMGELGIVLQFLGKSFSCDNPLQLAQAILDAMRQYDLQTAVQLRIDGQVINLSDNGQDVPLEVSVLNHVSTAGRIFQFRTRCVFNYSNVTLLVNNMPVEDAERCGRIRDNGALLAEGADARLQAIEADMNARRRREGIEDALPRVHGALDAVQDNYRRNCFRLTEVMIEFQESLLKSFVSLGLTEDQEQSLSGMATDFMQRMIDTQDESLSIVGRLEDLANGLAGLVKR